MKTSTPCPFHAGMAFFVLTDESGRAPACDKKRSHDPKRSHVQHWTLDRFIRLLQIDVVRERSEAQRGVMGREPHDVASKATRALRQERHPDREGS